MSSSTPLGCPTNPTVSLVTQPVGKHDAQEHIVLPPSEKKVNASVSGTGVAHRVVGGMSQSLPSDVRGIASAPCSDVLDGLADGIPHHC